MNGHQSLYRDALVRPHDAHRRAGSAAVVFVVLGLILATAIAVPMFIG
jgi:hypothetical protein